jgi:hypothetical protein
VNVAEPADSPSGTPAEDGLAQNLRRLAPAAPEGAPPAGLLARIAALDKGLPPSADAHVGGGPRSAWYKTSASGPAGPDRTGDEGVRMPTLQACPQCGAQFDVTSFARGQQFRCGACGHLMVAHAEASAPVTAGRVPGSRAPAPADSSSGLRPGAPGPRSQPAVAASSVAAAKSPRGPQFQPAQRSQDPGRPATPARAEPPPPLERGARERPRRSEISQKKSGPPLGLILGGAAVVVVGAVLFFVLGGKSDKDKGTAAGGGGASVVPTVAGGGPGNVGAGGTAPKANAPGETLAELKAEMERTPPDSDKLYKAYIERLKRQGAEGKDELHRLYEAYIETNLGRDNAEARAALGYVRFDFRIPEAITQAKGFPFVAAAEEYAKRGWLEDEDEIRLANEAKKLTEEHARRLLEDRVYRAGESIRANLLQKKGYKDYNFAVRWAAPHLICYTSKDSLSDFDLVGITKRAERKARLAELAEKRKHWEPILDEKEKIYSQLYVEFNKRFKEACNLGDLAAEYGGKPEYGSKKSFADGCPAVVWIFDNKASWTKFHQEQNIAIPSFAAGYFNFETEYVYLYDEGNEGDDRIFEISKNLHEGTHQLHHFFARQLNFWRKHNISQSWIGEGLAEYFGAHKMKPDGTIEFTQLNWSRMREAQEMAKGYASFKPPQEYPIAEVKEMVTWTSYGQADEYAKTRGINPGHGMSLFIYQQGSMLLYMCLDGLNGKYKDKMGKYFKMVLMQEEGQEPFRRAFEIIDDDDWEPLQKDFEAFVKDMLTKDLSAYHYTPPKRGSTGPTKDADGK